jgi:hypothetical protein
MMATTSIPRTVPVPRKRLRGLPVATRALINAKMLWGACVFYALFVALAFGLLYPVMKQINLDTYFSSNAVAGLLGAKVQHASGFAGLVGLELYGAFYGLLFGGIIAYIAGTSD